VEATTIRSARVRKEREGNQGGKSERELPGEGFMAGRDGVIGFMVLAFDLSTG